MEQKELTKGQLQNRLKNAILHIDKTKDTKSIYFDDKGLRLTINDDVAIIATGFHQHVFQNITLQGISRPWLYTKRFIEIAFDNDCTARDSKGQITHSYAKLFDLLDKKEDKSEFNVAWYYDLYISNLFHPLYTIGETETESFLVYETYLHNIARNQVILSEKINDLTNLQFIDETMALVKKFTEGMEEKVIFVKKTDEEKAKEEIEALQEQQQEKVMEEQANGSEQ